MTAITEASKPFCLDPQSVMEICPEADEVMVYGWKHCKYGEVHDAIQGLATIEEFPIKKVHSWKAGYIRSDETGKTLDGQIFSRLMFAEPENDIQKNSRPCKTALTNLVLENYLRDQEGLNCIPLIFCIDIDDNPKTCNSETILSRETANNNAITNKEIRRAFKLARYDDIGVQWAANHTFKFVKLTKREDNSYSMEAIAAPWESDDWVTNWNLRQRLSTSTPKCDFYSWRAQINLYLENATTTTDEFADLPDLIENDTVEEPK